MPFLWSIVVCGLIVCMVELSLSTSCQGRVVINEVYYDHPGSDDGWEFIELYNSGELERDLSGYRLEFIDGRTGRARTVWAAQEGLVLGPAAYLLVAGSNHFPPAGSILDGSLENGPDAVRLVSASGVLDVVGYGVLEMPGLFETEPAPDVEAGSGLARKPDGRDTDINISDFVPAQPSPGERNFFRHDLEVSMPSEDILPCRGQPIGIKLWITNTGLESFEGWMVIELSTFADDELACTDWVEYLFRIAVSCRDSLRLAVSPPPAKKIGVQAVLRGEFDENPRNDSAAVVIGTSPGVVVVSEVMYRPLEGRGEWIELLNRDVESVNLESWSVSDASSSKRLISEDDLLIAPGGYLILAQYPEAFDIGEPGCGAVVSGVRGGWPVLNDRDKGSWAETISLFDEDGVLVERTPYRDLVGDERGRSIERFSDAVCSSQVGGLWHRCASRKGSTPGQENSVHSADIDAARDVSVHPNPFCPLRDRLAVVSGSLREGETGFLLRIFDFGGIEVRRLFGEDGGARVFSCRWDGCNSNGSLVSTGLYICLFEFVTMGGGVCRKEKICIAVAGLKGG